MAFELKGGGGRDECSSPENKTEQILRAWLRGRAASFTLDIEHSLNEAETGLPAERLPLELGEPSSSLAVGSNKLVSTIKFKNLTLCNLNIIK